MTVPDKEAGQIVLFIEQGTSSRLTIAELEAIAEFAKEYHVDTISPKRADGEIKWYKTAANLEAERSAVLAKGVGYLPYAYCYGPGLSSNPTKQIEQVRGECAVLAEMMKANSGTVCADLEAEWSGALTAAAVFNTLMRPIKGLLYLTTFANPRTQGFPVAQLAPCVNAWVPQDYSNFLVTCESQQVAVGMSDIEPALDLSFEFGPNAYIRSAALLRGRGHKTLWLWDYAFARANPTRLRETITAFKTGVIG